MKKPAETTASTLYRLTNIPTDLTDLVKDTYLKRGMERRSIEIEGTKGIVVHGEISTPKPPKWARTVFDLTGENITGKNNSLYAVIILENVADSRCAWAISYGLGFHLINPEYIDDRFGFHLALRVVDPAQLQNLTLVAIDERAKTARTTIAAGASLSEFAIEDLGEFVTRVGATATIGELTTGEKHFRLEGASSLKIPLGTSKKQLINDLQKLDELLKTDIADPGLADLEKLILITNKNKIEELNKCLMDALPESKVGLYWPSDSTYSAEAAGAYKILGIGNTAPRQGMPLMADINDAAQQKKTYQDLKRIKIQLLENIDDQRPVGPQLTLNKWITYEFVEEGKTNFHFNGKWYSVEADYYSKITAQTKEIFGRVPELPEEIPEWGPKFQDENEYNQHLADTFNGVMMDKKLFRPKGAHSNFEVCDVFLGNGTYIYVKRTDESEAASHLLAQALVSTENLTLDLELRGRVAHFIRESTQTEYSDEDFAPRKVIIIMAHSGRVISADNLFSFTKVNLCRHDLLMRGRKVDLHVIPIQRVTKKQKI